MNAVNAVNAVDAVWWCGVHKVLPPSVERNIITGRELARHLEAAEARGAESGESDNRSATSYESQGGSQGDKADKAHLGWVHADVLSASMPQVSFSKGFFSRLYSTRVLTGVLAVQLYSCT